MDHYDTLDVPRNASPDQIKAMYRVLVQLFHPDRLQHVNAAVREYAEDVRTGRYPADEESYHLPAEVRDRLLAARRR